MSICENSHVDSMLQFDIFINTVVCNSVAILTCYLRSVSVPYNNTSN